jgi:hypothetical protein
MEFLDEAIAKLSAAPQEVEDAVCGLTEEQLSQKPTEFFSIRETVLHLRDIDIFGYEKRLRLMLTEDYPVLPDIDGAKLAIDRNYSALPVGPAIEDWKRSRALSIHRLKGSSAQDLNRRAEMQGTGPIDVRRLLELWIEHDQAHIAELMELRRAMETGGAPGAAPHQAA